MSPATTRRRTVGRRPTHRTAKGRKRGLGWRSRLILSGILVIFGLFMWGYLARRMAPKSNTSLTRFDAIIVLGSPADTDGNPSPTELTRVTEAVHEYERGVAPRLILTGGAVGNRFVEARVMAHTAEAQGIPESAIYVEPEARDTIQNACYACLLYTSISSGVHLSAMSYLPARPVLSTMIRPTSFDKMNTKSSVEILWPE